MTRSGLDWTAKFPETARAFGTLAEQPVYNDGKLRPRRRSSSARSVYSSF